MSVAVVFWDVDTQRDFMDPDGKLAVPDAQGIVENLKKLTEFAVAGGIPIVASADAHNVDDEEFEQFPPHCVAGTDGQKKIPETSVERSQVVDVERLEEQIEALRSGEMQQLIVEKQELDVFSEPATEQVLFALDPGRIVLYGVATEYCVLRAVRGLRERGFEVTVVSDAIRPVDEASGQEAVGEMEGMGARFSDTDSLIESKE